LYPEGACFLPAERRLLQAYASHAAAALDAAAARNFAERRSATTQALLTLAASLAEVGTTLEVATKLAEAIPEVVGCDTASVLLWEPVEHALRLGAARGMRANVEAKLRATPLTESEIPGLAAMIRSSRPVFLRYADVSAELRTLLHMSPGITIVVVPITHGDEFFGVVTASVRDGDGRLDDQHVLQQLRGMTDQAATALLNARLLEEIQHQALHDGLTGLPNRLLFKDRTEHAAAQARRTSASVALVFVDLNGFKAINDEHGHSAGDKLLVEVAHRLQRVVRAADTVGRLGGDEFAILLSDVADQHAIEALTARVLHEVRQPFPIRGHVVAVSASLGVAILQSDDDYDSLVHRADLAMYHEKHSGSRDTGDAGVAYDDRAVAV
jgi:diguanylate cyclase (GGDEF)-like protein